jgi:hypothetical protein
MVKILYEIEKVDSKVIPKFETTVTHLEDAASKANSLQIPSFGMSGYVASLGSKIDKCKKDCSGSINWLETCSSKFTECNTTSIDTFDKITVEKIKEKKDQINPI